MYIIILYMQGGQLTQLRHEAVHAKKTCTEGFKKHFERETLASKLFHKKQHVRKERNEGN